MKRIVGKDPESLSADVVQESLGRLKALFPEAVREGEADFEVLKELLGGEVVDREEKYGLNWHGKRRARQLSLTPSSGTLRPCPEESVDWDTTQNLVIEGDNLEALKLLQKSYAGRVKLIYIDPPYNTGKDFVYRDDYRDSIRNYLELTGQVDGERKRTSSRVDSSGRLHTDWLTMMYPRLRLARDLLQPDGVIFMSIDDTEHANLRTLCDEVFGGENFAGVIKRRASRKTAFLSKRMTDMCDYVIAYVRTDAAEPLTAGQVSEGTRPVFNEGNPVSVRVLREGAPAKCKDGVYRAGRYSPRSLAFELLDDLTVTNRRVVQSVRVSGPWRINQETLDETLFVTRNVGLRRTLLPSELGRAKLLNDLLDDPACYNERGFEELGSLFGASVFSNPKPIGLAKHLASAVGVKPRELILDFFAGSGTTGHAVMERNAADGGDWRYMLIQLPEELRPGSRDQEAAVQFCDSLGRPRTIAELTKERLRRAGSRVRADAPMQSCDLGFRVFRLDSSNIRVWEPEEDDLEGSLLDSIDHIRADRSEEDILYELLLKLGLDLCVPMETRRVEGRSIWCIGAGTLMACLDRKIGRVDVEPLALGIGGWQRELAPAGETTVVFRDSAFVDDVAKANMAAILEQLGFGSVRSL